MQLQFQAASLFSLTLSLSFRRAGMRQTSKLAEVDWLALLPLLVADAHAMQAAKADLSCHGLFPLSLLARPCSPTARTPESHSVSLMLSTLSTHNSDKEASADLGTDQGRLGNL
ncbi:hypothetical protein B0H67DRAFT_577554 [Lasiosphaeris hirsuta]|uniref:Uncharacterized protein n=1 Tax=Lasiosphaeris hirsuta TaxID=260670 RepID=A0AA40ARY1_9PEZI|nr:hypothetical protein B0H67DRAFT_577554 [Lasiosphaeris hirsuta]